MCQESCIRTLKWVQALLTMHSSKFQASSSKFQASFKLGVHTTSFSTSVFAFAFAPTELLISGLLTPYWTESDSASYHLVFEYTNLSIFRQIWLYSEHFQAHITNLNWEI